MFKKHQSLMEIGQKITEEVTKNFTQTNEEKTVNACEYCGSENELSAKKCSSCGANLKLK